MGATRVTRVLGPPIVLERAKKSSRTSSGKKKPRLADVDRAERHLYRAAKRTARAADGSVRRYNKARNKSARRERDGAVVDFMPNVARGMAVGLGRLAPVPLDLMRAGTPPSIRRMTRRSVRATARVIDRS